MNTTSTPYTRAAKRAPKRAVHDDPKGESAFFDWFLILVCYFVGYKLLRFVFDVSTVAGMWLATAAIVVLLGMLFRERYNNTLRDRRAGLR